MSDRYPLPDVFDDSRFHAGAERIVTVLGSLVALAGLFSIARPAYAEMQGVSVETHPDGPQAPAFVQRAVGQTGWEVGEGFVLLGGGVLMYSFGWRHRANRSMHRGIAETLHIETMFRDDSFPDE